MESRGRSHLEQTTVVASGYRRNQELGSRSTGLALIHGPGGHQLCDLDYAEQNWIKLDMESILPVRVQVGEAGKNPGPSPH